MSTPDNFDLSDGTWGGIHIDSQERRDLARFMQEHRLCDYVQGLQLRVSTASGIGQGFVVVCGCGRMRDLTNYAAW